MTPQEIERLREFRRGRAIAGLLVVLSVAIVGGIGVLAALQPDTVFRSPVIVFALPPLIWIALHWSAPMDWLNARRDLAEARSESVSGPARLRQQHRPGLFAGPRDRLLVGERVFAVHAGLADTIIPGHAVTVRYAPRSGALVSLEQGQGQGQAAPGAELPSDLTRRERELLALIAEGLTDKDIARRLNLSPATVRTYNSALYQKLGVTRRTQAIRIASNVDLTSVD